MEILKKILFVISSLLVLIFIFLIYWYYRDGKLGKGDYFIYDTGFHTIKSFKDKRLFLEDVLKTKHNNRYIIAIRLPMRVFYGDKNCTTFSEQQISYVLIDKQTDHIYETNDYEKFTQKLTKNNVQIFFSPEELKQAERKLKNRRHLYKNRQTLMYLEKYCKEDFQYPIEKF